MELTEIELKNIVGGSTTITSAFVNSIARAIETISELGKSFGSAIRRVSSNNICPLEK
ncbi:MAG: hypothetical protein IJ134_00080 [Bacilli bacterium]|nr:hypothetical protein [Bacilli bacterium]